MSAKLLGFSVPLVMWSLWMTVARMGSANAFSPDAQPPASRKPPNVLVIVADDLGYGELGCYGGDIPTPHLDALAAAGVRCTQGYVTAPFCAASRAALITGRIQTRFGFEFNPIGAQNAAIGVGLPVQESTFANMLRDHGYVTGLIGKWHLGGTAPYHPLRRGFDHFFGFLHEGHYYVPPPWREHVTWLRRRALPAGASPSSDRWTSQDGRVIWTTHMRSFEPDYDADNPILRNSQPAMVLENLTDVFTRETIDFIDQHHRQPFCAMVAYNAVHSPMQAPDSYLAKFSHIPDMHRRIFVSMVSHLDDSVGQILHALDQHGLTQNTLVFFVSDNGGPTRELTSSNRPLRGEKGSLLEGGIRVPMILRWPAQWAPATVLKKPVSSLDLAATLADVLDAKTSKPLDGISLLRYINNPDSTRPAPLFWRVGEQAALRRDGWKIYRSKAPNSAWQLFQVETDPAELHDLNEQEQERLKEMTAEWHTLNATMVAPLWK
jgi:arylsulfatase B